MKKNIKFYWLDQRTKDEILALNPAQLKTLQRSISRIESNPELLEGRCSFTSLVKSGVKELREFKKRSKGGYRVFFSLLPDLQTAVLIGKSPEKSSSEMSLKEVERWIELSKRVCSGKISHSRVKFSPKLAHA